MNRIRVTHFASADLWAGAENVIFQIVRGQHASSEFDVSVVLLNHGVLAEQLREEGVSVTIFDETQLSFFHIARKAVSLCRSERPHIVHTHRIKENILGSICSIFCPGVRSIRTVHGGDEYSAGSTSLRQVVLRFLDRSFAMRLQRAIVFVSSELKERVCEQFPANKLRVIRNGIVIDRMQVDAFRFPGQSDSVKILFAGRLSRVKRLDLFLNAARKIVNSGQLNANFYLVGDGPETGFCKDFIKNHGLERRVYLLGFRPGVLPVIRSANILVLCSDHEGLPMVVLEAMALGTLVVARAVGDIPYVLDFGRCGVLWESTSSDSDSDLADVLTGAVRNSSEYEQKVVSAKKRVEESFSVQETVSSYGSLYSELLRGSR